ncbi:PREDICTED: uncharacterized protein LOC109580118 [Amphimedon queenslandica]|uniref:Death domain-containing protein n=2 Tax=Amphimedon queenslandica TaxID=400682 RepID=A0AAN0JS60_AMPQE|nr:PREDICTED: uncharacterized protein LOC109580118 [Amphimedon queenslandica]|eukprot:XP_019859714.1 PREDICTED: uncharacterized protein LOC109580118 [Amphimedon queenslandica]
MAAISKRVGDKAATLAACLEMLQKFKALQQNPAHSYDPMLHLLYEWKIGGGCREDLIEALKCADLHQLADQVKVSDYKPASGRLSVVNFCQSTNEQCSDFDPFQEVEDIQTKNKDSTHEITEAGVKATRDSGQLTDLYTNQRHQEISEASRDIEEDDLLRSSNFFDAEKIKKFVEICDDDLGYLQSVMDKYQRSDTQTIAFQVLRAMVRKNPNITKESLKRKLHLMKFEEAANNLSEPSQLAQATQTTSTEATPQDSQPAQSNSICLVL